jgi:hypothetical protein
MSGALKHVFDLTFDQASQDQRRTPFSYYVHGRSDTSGAERAMEAITTGLGWVKVCEPVCFLGEPTGEHLAAVHDLGATVAATLM